VASKSEIIGVVSLANKFKVLGRDMETRTSRVMVVAAGGVLKRRAKAIALAKGLKRSGAMIKNIAIKRETEAPAGTAQYNLGVRHGRDLTKKQKAKPGKLAVSQGGRIVKRYEDDPYYWAWVERGHKVVARASAVDRRGIAARRRGATGKTVPPHPFIEPALEQGRGDAIEAMDKALDKELKKAQR